MMGGADRFAALAQQLTEELQREHEHQISKLVAEINELKSKLEGSEGCPPQPRRESLAQDATHEIPGELASREGRQRNKLSVASRRSGLLTFSSNRYLAVVEKAVNSHAFEVFFSVLILLNGVVLAFEAQHESTSVASYLGYEDTMASHDPWAGANDTFQWIGWAFGVLFTLEIALRIAAFRTRFPYDIWNWLDLIIVIVWFVGEAGSSILPINPQLIRLARFVRLMRLLKLARRIGSFDSLFLMITSLQHSAVIMAWSGCLLLLVLMFNALLLNSCLSEFYFKNDRFPESERLELFQYFGSFTTSLFSMFELTLANWPPISRKLYEYVSGWFILLAIAHKLTIGFAVIGVINGVFMQETFRAAQHDDDIMLRRARRASRIHGDKMRRLVEMADDSGEVQLDVEEFRRMFMDPEIKAWLTSMEFNPGDVDVLFQMMDNNGDGTLSVEEVVTGVGRLKGSARNIDLHVMLREQQQLRRYLERHFGLPI